MTNEEFIKAVSEVQNAVQQLPPGIAYVLFTLLLEVQHLQRRIEVLEGGLCATQQGDDGLPPLP